VHAEEAKERMKEGASKGGKASPKNNKPMAKLPEPSKPQSTARDKAAKQMNVSPRTVQDAQAVREKNPEIAEQVRNGTMDLAEAKRKVGVGQSSGANAEPAAVKGVKRNWLKCTKLQKKQLWIWLEAND
jgi:hypothetical protein